MASGVSALAIISMPQPASAGPAGTEVYRPILVSASVFHWQVGLTVTKPDASGVPRNTRCGGTLISPVHVLTAAHCVDQALDFRRLADGEPLSVVLPTAVSVRFGGESFDQLARFTIRSISVHPQWRRTPNAFEFDAAILVLDAPSTGRSLALRATSTDPTDPRAWVSGWGTTSTGQLPSKLGAAKIALSPQTVCQSYWGSLLKVTPNMVCTIDADNVGCAGDSGGPLVIGSLARPQLLGIVSAGLANCGDRLGIANRATSERFVGIYTRVSAIADWAVSTTQGRATLTNDAPEPLFEAPLGSQFPNGTPFHMQGKQQ